MKAALSVLILLLALPAGGVEGRTPVIVELFTSEGCSSCPPADALLMQLGKNQPVPGAEVIILSEHVDYWNRLGWVDPFSAAAFSKRQEDYAFTLHVDGPYTPQMIVDGRAEFNGADAKQARDAIGRAAHVSKANVALTAAAEASGVRLQIKVGALDSAKADVLIAITESDLQTNVLRGENGGRNLAHAGVVRRLSQAGTATKAGFTAEQILALDPSWKRENLRVVVFLQERTTRRVLGAASISL